MLRSVDKVADAVTTLKHLLEISPTDAEAWSELADIYLSQGVYTQAIFALEEVLLLMPTAWNVSDRRRPNPKTIATNVSRSTPDSARSSSWPPTPAPKAPAATSPRR